MDDDNQNTALTVRSATPQDELWLWEQYSELLKPSIDTQWGWDEAFQLSNFQEHLPYSLFSVVEKSNTRVAAYATKTDEKCIYLHMLLVASEHQLHGVGSHVLNVIKARSRESNLPIELSVFPENQVKAFYAKNRFELVEATDDKQLFRWIPE